MDKDRQKVKVILLYRCGFSYVQIAQHLKLTKGQVAGIITRNREMKIEKVKMDKHLSYGYETLEEIELHKSADAGGKDQFAREKLLAEIKGRGRVWEKRKRSVSRPLFESE